MGVAVQVEFLKLRRSLVGVITTGSLLLGTLALLAGIALGIAQGQSALIAKLGPAARLDWSGLLGGATQIVSVAAFLGFGVMLAWIFGREFADGTITGLFALPISRTRIALAKLIVFGLWAVLVGLLLSVGVLCLGLAFGYGPPTSGAWVGLLRLWALAVLTGAAAVPVAWVATLTGSLLAAVGCTIGLVVVAQVSALTGVGGWIPVSAPTLWAMSSGTVVSAVQLVLLAVFAFVFVVLAAVSWARMQLNR